MGTHLKKLCVGIDSLEGLQNWQEFRGVVGADGVKTVRHITRNVPKRSAELLDGGSLYWVVKGRILARNTIHDIEEIEDEDGKRMCAIVLEVPSIAVWPEPHRPFQGWRYLAENDAPEDRGETGDLPTDMADDLKGLGLL